MKQLAPILGDHKYSNFIKTINNRPFFIDVTKFKKNEQILNPRLLQHLGMNSYMSSIIPLHLHLYEINLDKKFKKQKIQFKIKAPFYSYFTETLNRFNLKLDPTRL